MGNVLNTWDSQNLYNCFVFLLLLHWRRLESTEKKRMALIRRGHSWSKSQTHEFEKKTTWFFFYIKYRNFWSTSLQLERKSFISEEHQTWYVSSNYLHLLLGNYWVSIILPKFNRKTRVNIIYVLFLEVLFITHKYILLLLTYRESVFDVYNLVLLRGFTIIFRCNWLALDLAHIYFSEN